MTIPDGATHMIPANPLDYEPRPTYMRLTFRFYSLDSGRSYYGWDCWNGTQWCKDNSFCDRHNVLVALPLGGGNNTE